MTRCQSWTTSAWGGVPDLEPCAPDPQAPVEVLASIGGDPLVVTADQIRQIGPPHLGCPHHVDDRPLRVMVEVEHHVLSVNPGLREEPDEGPAAYHRDQQ